MSEIDHRIEAITAEDPQLLDRVHEQARQLALESLGLAETQRELAAVRKEKLDELEDELETQILSRIRGVPASQVGSTYGCDTEINKAIRPRVEAHEEHLLKDSDVSRRILELRREKDNLLDTVWLATSSVQIKELWGKVAELLGDAARTRGADDRAGDRLRSLPEQTVTCRLQPPQPGGWRISVSFRHQASDWFE